MSGNIDRDKQPKGKDELSIRSSAAEYLTYIASTGGDTESYEVLYQDEDIWITQKMMASLYNVSKSTISEHISKIYADSELDEESTVRKFRTVQIEGDVKKERSLKHYNLKMIIAVGFKVNSERAVQFRKWINQIAKDYTIKGWVMDSERIKRGTFLTDKYFDEQLERVREIRASERLFYQKITDIYATSVDYDKNAAATKRFYASVQNKMHYAVHGHTAAELIVERADHTKKHMGVNLIVWYRLILIMLRIWPLVTSLLRWQTGRQDLTVLSRCSNTGFLMMPVKLRRRLQSCMRNPNLRSTELSKMSFSFLTTINICWNWKSN